MSLPEEATHKIELRRLSGSLLATVDLPLSTYGRTLRGEVSLLLRINRRCLGLLGDVHEISDEDMLCERISGTPLVVTLIINHEALDDTSTVCCSPSPCPPIET